MPQLCGNFKSGHSGERNWKSQHLYKHSCKNLTLLQKNKEKNNLTGPASFFINTNINNNNFFFNY